MDPLTDVPVCVGCGARAPERNDDDALVSSATGWRLTRHMGTEGECLQWRCPECWRTHKARVAGKGGQRARGTFRRR
jgi:hypothetical protein